MNFSTKICKQIVNIILPKIHTLFTLYSLTFGLACVIIDTESEGKRMGNSVNDLVILFFIFAGIMLFTIFVLWVSDKFF